MAFDILTATPEELEKQFPSTARPFAVFYYSDAENGKYWNVNNENGVPTAEFEDFAEALKVAADMGREWEAEGRKQAQALAKITGAALPHIEVCRNLFGEHPEDVISPINCASDTLLQLVEIFNTISSEALKERNGYRIKYLAEAGSHLAHDMGNYTDCVYGTMIDRLREAGVVSSEAEAAHA